MLLYIVFFLYHDNDIYTIVKVFKTILELYMYLTKVNKTDKIMKDMCI